MRAGSSLQLYRQYLQWYVKHVVADKPEEVEIPVVDEVMEEVKVEEKPIVEAYGIGKTGFIDMHAIKEEAKKAVPIVQASSDQTNK